MCPLDRSIRTPDQKSIRRRSFIPFPKSSSTRARSVCSLINRTFVCRRPRSGRDRPSRCTGRWRQSHGPPWRAVSTESDRCRAHSSHTPAASGKISGPRRSAGGEPGRARGSGGRRESRPSTLCGIEDHARRLDLDGGSSLPGSSSLAASGRGAAPPGRIRGIHRGGAAGTDQPRGPGCASASEGESSPAAAPRRPEPEEADSARKQPRGP